MKLFEKLISLLAIFGSLHICGCGDSVAFVDVHTMAPTIPRGGRVEVGLNDYGSVDPKRWEIVAFKPNIASNTDVLFVLRVIGLPGELVEIDLKGVKINGKRLVQPTRLAGIRYASLPLETNPPNYERHVFALGASEYFLLGDDVTNALDSRCLGPISLDTIVGRAK